ncbi:hypothetical protein-transmembrane prediction [Rhodopirellula baltica SH 1]|uniref:Uncharacterized protein n=1 Tax=Rhodopirellula baltica (strain DSM 10527 / NCIMB 13988 / SH1) TaxID=243090 RepID=Q7UV08_RHOBA|nr:hypothetical protein-transmembrane prediction [Rhodopirellula baltica SH 1]
MPHTADRLAAVVVAVLEVLKLFAARVSQPLPIQAISRVTLDRSKPDLSPR